ncbi:MULTISPECIES: amidase [unclassified Leucobacter]|uniref:amidase n=1 Tax=unclassified Leucobacter TaxID=2621730 RepID=UPI001BFE7D05|nr:MULTISPECIES: amidase family protein [unclassified Leucobacter]
MDTEIHWLPATELAEMVRSGDLSSRDIAEALVAHVERVNPQVNALITWDPEQVLRDAAWLDEHQAKHGVSGPLHGVPYTIKDLTAVAGLPLTQGIVTLKDNVVDHDAPIVERMKRAGGLFLGKTNTPEAGYCGKTSNHLFGATRNPWNPAMSAGGSSGGAGAAVAAGLGPLAEGSDGGGSIRVPAAFNGVVGFKPSTGRIPHTSGSARYATNIFHGPLTRTVADTALMLDVTAGEDPRDPLSLPDPLGSYLERLDGEISGWHIAYSPDLGFAHVDPEITRIVESAVGRFADAGAIVEEATPDWPHPDDAMWNGVWVPGLASLSGAFDLDQMAGLLDDELIELVRAADALTATDVALADVVRGQIYDAFERFMRTFRIIASPTTMTATYPVERFNPAHLDGLPVRDRLLGWSMTHIYNLTTTPAISVPCGFTADGRPVGLMLAGRLHADGDVLNAARAFERLQPWAELRPALAR